MRIGENTPLDRHRGGAYRHHMDHARSPVMPVDRPGTKGGLPICTIMDVNVTPFRRRVYDATSAIPRGRVSTYALVAASIGCSCPRAVAQALRHNPFAPQVPCHRVISADGRLTGFRGSREPDALNEKRALLRDEGVLFDEEGRIIDASLIVAPGDKR